MSQEGDLETSQDDGEANVLNLLASVTNSDSTSNGSLRLRSSRRFIEEMDVEEESILNCVPLSELLKEECSELREIADAWISTYESSPFEALRSMLELILHSTGVLKLLTKEQALQLDKLEPETYNAWMREPNVEALILQDVFSDNFLEFLKMTLVCDVCLDDILIMKRIKYLLEVFAHSTWVSTRYCCLLISSLITVQYMRYWSQLDNELRNVSVTGSQAGLSEQNKALAKNFFEEYIELVISSQRDVILTIRKLAYEIHFDWFVNHFGPLLMDDNYIRHIYWGMFDDSPLIRSLAIKTCGSLYKSENVVKICQNLPKFVTKSLSGMATRTSDENDRVATTALKVLLATNRHSPRLLKGAELEKLFILVYGKGWRGIRGSEIFHEILENMSSTNEQYIYNLVLFIMESMEEITNLNIENAINVLVRNLFPHASRKLTDWRTWRQLMLSDTLDQSKKLQEIAGLLLFEVIDRLSVHGEDRFFIQMDYPPVPRSYRNMRNADSGEATDERLKSECLNHLVRMTTELGPHLVPLWEKNKDKTCLIKLVSIPQYFNGSIDSLDVRGICCYLVYLRNMDLHTSPLDAVHRSLASLHHLLSTSESRSHLVPSLERVLFNPVCKKFLTACQKLAECERPLPKRVEMNCLKIIKQVFFLSKYFDVTKTSLLEDAIYALKYGVAKGNTEIVVPTLTMTLYILEWQVKSLVEDITTPLTVIQSQSRTLFELLQDLLRNEDPLTRETAYSVMCRLMIIFSESNKYMEPYPLLYLPPVPMDTAEWLGYTLTCLVPVDQVPQDKVQFLLRTTAVKMFCTLLKAQVLSIYYMPFILVYFQFYSLPKNYSSILLSTLQVLAKSDDFPYVLVQALIWLKTRPECDVEEITKGICAVGLPKLSPKREVECITREIIGFGLSQITTRKDYFLFPILAHFVKLLQRKDEKFFYSNVMKVFYQDVDVDEVSVFLSAFSNMENITDSSQRT